MGFNRYDPSGCDCSCGSTCNQTFTVEGCNSITYAGVTVEVYDSAGTTLLDSGTTDAVGEVTLSWSGSSGNHVVKVTGASARFDAYDQTLNLTCGGSQSITLTPATGFHCWVGSGCLLPVADTVHVTDTVLGTATLTYNAGISDWSGTSTYAFPGFNYVVSGTGAHVICGAVGSLQINWRLNGNTTWVFDSSNVGTSSAACPDPFGGSLAGISLVTISRSITCPASLSVVDSLTITGTDPNSYRDKYACLYDLLAPTHAQDLKYPVGTVFATRTYTE